MLVQEPLAIVVCGETKGQPFDGYWVQDCSAATENLLLAAHASAWAPSGSGHPREDRAAGVRSC